MPKKPVVTTNKGLFLVLGSTVQSQQNSRYNVGLYCPVVVLRPGRPEVRILPVAPKKGRCIAVQRPFLFCHGSVIVNPSFDYVRGNIGHDRHEKTDKIAHGISFPCWFCTSGSTRAILSVFVFIKNPIQSFGRQSWAQKAHSGACCQQRITRRPLLEPRRKGCHSASRGGIRDYASVHSAFSICFRS